MTLRHIIYTIILLSAAHTVSAQKDFQMESDTPYHRLMVFLNDTSSASPTYGLGSWELVDSVKGAFGDYDFYGLGTGRAPAFGEDSLETALDSMYVLFKGLTGGLATKIEMLQDGILQFDTEEGLSDRVFARIRPLKYSDGEPDWNFGLETSSGTSDRNNSIFWGGWNLSPGGVRTTGTGTAFGFSFEDHFSPTSSLHASEAHLVVFIDSSGVMTRPVSFLFDKGDNTTWRGDFLMRSFSLNDPVNENPYANFDGNTTQSILRLLGSTSETGVEFFLDAANNNLQISNYGMSSPFLFTNTFYGTVVNKLNVQSFESTPDQLIGLNSGDKYVGQITLGSGLQLTGGSLVANISQAFHEVGTSTPPNAITDDIFKSSGKVGIGETTPANILEVVAAAADSDESILRLSGGASGFSGSNDADNEHSIIFDLCAFNGSITQQSAGQIGVKKEGSWNESDNGFPGIPASLVFKTQSGSVASPDLSTKLTIASDGEITLNEYTTSNFNGGIADDSVLVVTSTGVVKKRNASAFGGSGGDDWGADVVNTNITLTGDGTVGNVLKVDTSIIATQYDLTLISSGSTDLTIGGSGPTYTIESSTGTDVTISASGILALTESPANTLVFTATEVDGSITNEGSLSVATGSGTTSVINSNTSGSTGVTLTAGTGLSISENTGTGTITLTNTVTDTDTDDQGLTITGSGPTYTIDIDGGSDVIIAASGILSLSESPANTLVFTATEVDGSVTNETNTIEEGNVSVQTGNLNLDFQSLFDIATDGGTEVNISLDLSEATTVTSTESDDWIIMHDAGSSQHQKMLWTDFLIDLIEFKDGNSSVGTGSIIDVGEGLDINMSPSDEANINLDASEFQIDGAADGTEYVIIHDTDTTAGHQIQRRLVSSFGGADGNGIYDGDGTTPSDVDVTMTDNIRFGTTTNNDLYIDGSGDRVGIGTGSPSYGLHVLRDAGAAVESETAGTGGLVFKLEGKADGGGANTDQAGIIWAYTDADYSAGAEQNAFSMILHKESDASQWSTLKLTMNEATDASMVFEKNAGLTAPSESHVAIGAGMAFTQNFTYSTSADLELDRSYFTINVAGGTLTDTIKLPEVASTTDNWDSALTATQCQVGQMYVITNFRAIDLKISAYNPTSGNSDLINSQTPTTGASTFTLEPNHSATIRCVRLASGVGYWYYTETL